MLKNKLVCGVGVNNFEGQVYVSGVPLKSYKTWNQMLTRCYSSSYLSKFPTYLGCSVCNEWLSFSNFKIWFDENYVEGFHLDKDILVEGNKVYSAEFCRFVPSYLNSLLVDSRAKRGNYPIGVSATLSKGQKNTTYLAQCHNGHGKQLNKTFKTIEEASSWYSETKTRIVKEQAQRAFLENAIKTDVYLALVRRKW